jgi:transcriptional regulator of acetoin/glycerol metabolism
MAQRVDALLSPFTKAVLDTISEGVVLFDPSGRVVYANAAGHAAMEEAGVDGKSAEAVLPKLARVGGRIAPIWVGGSKICEMVRVPSPENGDGRTLAERERYAIIETLESTGWKLTESARKLGISRTTLWRRLRAYGLDRDNRARWFRSS